MITKKRGISSVIATVLLVLLTIATAGILAGILVPLVRDNINKSTECMDYTEYFSFDEDFGYNCYNMTNASYSVSVSAKTVEKEIEELVKGFELRFIQKGESDIVSVRDGEDVGNVSMINLGETKIDVPGAGETKTFVVKHDAASKIEIYVTLASGRICEEKSDSINVLGAYC